MIIERFDDMSFSVVVKPKETAVWYDIYYELEIEDESDIIDENPSLSCWVRFDGCIEVSCHPNPMHFCTEDQVNSVSKILVECLNLTSKYCRKCMEGPNHGEYWQSTDKAPWEHWRD